MASSTKDGLAVRGSSQDVLGLAGEAMHPQATFYLSTCVLIFAFYFEGFC